MKTVTRVVVAVLLLALGVNARAEDALVILPKDFTLNGPVARQTLLVDFARNGRHTGRITDNLSLASSDEKIVRIENRTAVPVANGSATLTATHNGHTTTATVTVRDMDKPWIWSFRNHVQPVLMKAGCSTGACHGALAGQNGFRLSLRGYDDDGDHRTLTRHTLSRRINFAEPGKSLLLLKPAGAISHKGGNRFATDSLEYRVLAEWIAAGAPAPRKDDRRIDRIEILPSHTMLRKGMEHPLVVLARFTDGTTEDVTRWTKYTSTDTTVATIDDNGLVKVMGNGEGTITAWYLSKLATATVTVPFTTPVSESIYAESPRRNLIDELVLEKLRELNLPPSPQCTDSEFVRRAFLDTIGLLPTADETRAFLADPSADKRHKLIDALLARPEFVDYWSYKWSDLLLVSSRKLRPPAMWSYYNWVREQVAANTPWDQFVRRLVTARGSTLENGAANFFLLHEDPTNLSETLSVATMGMAINCAKCHNHPLEKWTNDQYFGMASLFSRVRTKNASGDGNHIVFAADEGELIQPLTGKPQLPRPLDAQPVPFDSPRDRREVFADWLVARDNPYFARAITNRVWANFMGVGLVELVDDMRLTNPASNEKLLNALAAYLADNKYDLKSLMRLILQSHAYQRSSKALPENAADQRFYARYYPRRIMAESLLDSLSQVTGAPTNFAGYPLGWRAMQLPDATVESNFLKTFGRADRVSTCECERTDDPSMAQVLHIANGDTINQKLAAKGNRIEHHLSSKTPNEQIIDEAYLSALCRPPTAEEKQKVLSVLNEAKESEKRLAIEDFYWSLLSSNEFLFNH